MKQPDYSKWHICCLLRELEKQMPENQRRRSSRDFILDSIRRYSPSEMDDTCGNSYTLRFLLNHLLEWWSKGSEPIDGLDHFRDELKRRLAEDKKK